MILIPELFVPSQCYVVQLVVLVTGPLEGGCLAMSWLMALVLGAKAPAVGPETDNSGPRLLHNRVASMCSGIGDVSPKLLTVRLAGLSQHLHHVYRAWHWHRSIEQREKYHCSIPYDAYNYSLSIDKHVFCKEKGHIESCRFLTSVKFESGDVLASVMINASLLPTFILINYSTAKPAVTGALEFLSLVFQGECNYVNLKLQTTVPDSFHTAKYSQRTIIHQGLHKGVEILCFTSSSGAPWCLCWGPAAGVFLLLESTWLFFLSPDVEHQGVAQIIRSKNPQPTQLNSVLISLLLPYRASGMAHYYSTTMQSVGHQESIDTPATIGYYTGHQTTALKIEKGFYKGLHHTLRYQPHALLTKGYHFDSCEDHWDLGIWQLCTHPGSPTVLFCPQLQNSGLWRNAEQREERKNWEPTSSTVLSRCLQTNVVHSQPRGTTVVLQRDAALPNWELNRARKRVRDQLRVQWVLLPASSGHPLHLPVNGAENIEQCGRYRPAYYWELHLLSSSQWNRKTTEDECVQASCVQASTSTILISLQNHEQDFNSQCSQYSQYSHILPTIHCHIDKGQNEFRWVHAVLRFTNLAHYLGLSDVLNCTPVLKWIHRLLYLMWNQRRLTTSKKADTFENCPWGVCRDRVGDTMHTPAEFKFKAHTATANTQHSICTDHP
ncbi:hypothetical protein PR048_011246 [Dryococelus australis]|uniref:Uncharacterized protein n=1 Tax=Dryococelus australis TaxID=614101 RepID=A0ABQ9HL83_9NEOP|nr:hypothetical protein PR048_011246 [Dryococelus australis]